MMDFYEILIKRLRCEANSEECPHNCSTCRYGLPPELHDYNTRDLMQEAADKIEQLTDHIKALQSDSPITFTNSGIYFKPKLLSKSECRNLAEFIELHLLADIREDDNIDNIEWVRSMLDAHKKLMEASGMRWNEDRECWEEAK